MKNPASEKQEQRMMWSSKKSPKPAILSRYLVRLTAIYCAVAMLFASLTLSAFYLRDLLKLGIEKSIPAFLLLKIFGLTQLAQFGLVFPIALFLAVVVSLSGLSASREVIAMRAVGMSFFEIARPYLRMGIFLLPIIFVWHQLAIPWARGNFRELRSFFESYAPLDLGADNNNTFTLPKENGIVRIFHFSDKIFDTKMRTHIFRGMSILESSVTTNNETISRITFAENAFAVQSPDSTGHSQKFLRMAKGYSLDFKEQSESRWRATYFPQGILDLRLPESAAPKPEDERAKDSMYLPELIKKRDQFKASADAGLRHEALNLDHEIHQRFALPFAVPVLLSLGFLLAVTTSAESRWHRIILALVLISAYYAVFILAKMLAVETGLMPPWFAAWLPNIMLLFPAATIATRLNKV